LQEAAVGFKQLVPVQRVGCVLTVQLRCF